jgi:hypothetical protein
MAIASDNSDKWQSWVTTQVVVSLIESSIMLLALSIMLLDDINNTGFTYSRNIFIVQATQMTCLVF